MVASTKEWWKKQDTEVAPDLSAPRRTGELPDDDFSEDLVDRTRNIRGFPVRLPTHDEIQMRAYDIYERSGHQDGQCEKNWLQAEQELLTETRNGTSEDGTVKASPVVTESEF